jgi:hypothetical protein
MNEKARYYMIFYRPEGSATWTPVGEFHGVKGNLFAKSWQADKVRQLLSEENPEHEFEVFVCQPCEWVALSSEDSDG